jgi:sigma-B regulation protein RsbU (phosphoserine phosphatase)
MPRVRDFVTEFCTRVGCDDDTTALVTAAIAEAVSNVVNYAYPEGATGDITLEAASNDIRLKFTIMDTGKPFDPTVLSTDDEPHDGGQYASKTGIRLMRQNMDTINYERMDNLNILTLRKKLK